MTWKKSSDDISYDYILNGKPVANIKIIGIRGRWRWTIVCKKNDDRRWCGTKSTKEEAKKSIINYFNEDACDEI